MEKILELLSKVIVGAALIAFAATLGGTLIWLLYPHIHALFPHAAANGIIAQNLGWWDSVCIVWILAIVLKPTPNRKS